MIEKWENVMREVTVIKQNLDEQETWRYQAHVLRDLPNGILLEAFFNRADMDVHGMTMARGDRFVEVYYTDRWYNIFEIYSYDRGELRGWYCNVNRPARLSPQVVSYVDLALDLLVFPDGRQLVLDEDEFAALPLSQDVRGQAQSALQKLRALFQPPVVFRLQP